MASASVFNRAIIEPARFEATGAPVAIMNKVNEEDAVK